MIQLGLLGKKLSHSFSKNYFEQKFKKEQLDNYSYTLFELDDIEELPELLEKYPDLIGFNVTIPFKTAIIPFLDELDEKAKAVNAVNTVCIERKEEKSVLKGYNTDIDGFANSIKPFLKNIHERALILGTGGASKAVEFVLNNLGIETLIVSRSPQPNQLNYSDVNKYVIKYHNLIVNCTPLGMYPNISSYPNIPYEFLNESHTLIDLVYNPEVTEFLKRGKKEQATILNGSSMLYNQADKAWEIWKNCK